jgi:hypothetical protein
VRRHHLAARFVLRRDRHACLFRVARAVWQRGVVGDGRGYSSSVSLALRPSLFSWRKEWNGWILTIVGVRLHYRRDYGGVQV